MQNVVRSFFAVRDRQTYSCSFVVHHDVFQRGANFANRRVLASHLACRSVFPRFVVNSEEPVPARWLMYAFDNIRIGHAVEQVGQGFVSMVKRGALIRQFVLVSANQDRGGLGGFYGNGVEPVRNKLKRLRIGGEVVIGPFHCDLQR